MRFGSSVLKQKEYFRQERTGIRKPKRNFKIQIISKQFLADMLLFTAALVTMIMTLVIIYIMYGKSKLKALVTNIVMQ